MIKFNVKFTQNTNLMADILTTKCAKADTAVSRFCRFLSDCDSSFKESVLIAFMTIRPAGYVDGVLAYQSVSETDDYYVTVSGLGSVWSVTFEFKRNKNIKHYRSIFHPSLTDNVNPDNTATDNTATDNTATDNTATDNTTKIHHMKCEYFISSSPNSNFDCRHCIYYDYGACPADMEHYKLVCDD